MQLKSLTLGASTVQPNTNLTATLYLTSNADAYGRTVLLSADSAFIKVPRSVVIPAGQNSVQFTVEVGAIYVETDYVVRAQLEEKVLKAVLHGVSLRFADIDFSSDPVHSGDDVTVTVTLPNAAGEGGVYMALSEEADPLYDRNYFLNLPISLGVAQGDTTASFTVKMASVKEWTTVGLVVSKDGVDLIERVVLLP